MLSNLKIAHKGLLLVLIPLIFEIFFFGLIFYFLQQAEDAMLEEAKSKRLIDEAYSITTTIYDTGRMLATCWYANDFSRISSFTEQIAALEGKYKTLWDLTSGRPRQRAHVEKIQSLSRQMMGVFQDEILPSISSGEVAGTSDVSYFGQRCDSFNTPLLKEVNLLIQDEKAHFERTTKAVQKKQQDAKSIILVCLCLSFIITGIVLFSFSVSVTQRLRTISANVDRFANRRQLIPVEGTDEISGLDNEFRAMATKIKSAEESKQEFLSMISHDMRTPLSALQGTLAVAGMGAYGDLNDYGIERMAKAEANVGRLIGLINDLLDIERIESGSLRLDIEECELWELVSNAVDTVQPVADEKRIELVNKCDEIFIFCDGRRVEQILVNLIANSVKFSPEGSDITITSEQLPDKIKLSVIDKGRGISAEQQEKIFKRFEQVEKGDATDKKGYGLGLAIAKSLTEAHHGEIGVNSVPGEGATFWFTLPIAKLLG